MIERGRSASSDFPQSWHSHRHRRYEATNYPFPISPPEQPPRGRSVRPLLLHCCPAFSLSMFSTMCIPTGPLSVISLSHLARHSRGDTLRPRRILANRKVIRFLWQNSHAPPAIASSQHILAAAAKIRKPIPAERLCHSTEQESDS